MINLYNVWGEPHFTIVIALSVCDVTILHIFSMAEPASVNGAAKVNTSFFFFFRPFPAGCPGFFFFFFFFFSPFSDGLPRGFFSRPFLKGSLSYSGCSIFLNKKYGENNAGCLTVTEGRGYPLVAKDATRIQISCFFISQNP
jgi:hypothetical protein